MLTDLPEDLIFVVFLLLLLVGVIVTLRGRMRGTTGGITPRSMEGRDGTGGEGPSRDPDREAADALLDQHGQH